MILVPLKRKLGEENEKARLLENEGFYVGNRPYMTIKNRNMMEDRFLRLPDNVNLIQTQIICRNFKTNCLPNNCRKGLKYNAQEVTKFSREEG